MDGVQLIVDLFFHKATDKRIHFPCGFIFPCRPSLFQSGSQPLQRLYHPVESAQTFMEQMGMTVLQLSQVPLKWL
jgi:hypothetical protein